MPNRKSSQSSSSNSPCLVRKDSYGKGHSHSTNAKNRNIKQSSSSKKKYNSAAVATFVAFLSLIAGVSIPSFISYRRHYYGMTNNASSKSTKIQSTKEDDDDESNYIYRQREQHQDNSVSGDGDNVSSRRSYTNIKTDQQIFPCTTDNLSQFLHDQPIRGMHIICFEGDGTNLNLYERASHHTHLRTSMEINLDESYISFRQRLASKLHIVEEGRGRPKQPWAIFTTQGERAMSADEDHHSLSSIVLEFFMREGMLVIFEGGTWMWPGVRTGFKRIVELYSIIPEEKGMGTKHRNRRQQRPPNQPPRNVTIETLSLLPLVLSIEHFISESECAHIQSKAQGTVRYSDVTLMDHDKGKPSSDWRTSQSTFLPSTDDAKLDDLDWRTASLTRVPRSHQEHIQVLRYGHTEKYSAHHDFFHPNNYKNDPRTMALIENGKRNRFATVLWYLSDVERGGHTIFPRAGGKAYPRDMDDCTRGLKVKPEMGKVLIFYSLQANGAEDDYSLHGACPVIEGTK